MVGGAWPLGYLDYDPATGRYALPADHVPVLAEEAGPFFFGSAFFDFSINFGETYRRLVDAFRDGGGVPQSEYGAEVAESIERCTAPWFEHMLVQQWLPLMPDPFAKLEEGAIACDLRGRALDVFVSYPELNTARSRTSWTLAPIGRLVASVPGRARPSAAASRSAARSPAANR